MRRFLSPIALRLLLFNVLLVFVPVAGLFSLRSFERQLLDLQERSMVQQGRVVAAALSANPHALNPEDARALLQRLGGRSEARIRIINAGGKVIADSASHAPVAIEGDDAYPSRGAAGSRERLLYRVGAKAYLAMARIREFFGPETSSLSSSGGDATPRDIVAKALRGRYGATLRESAGQRSLTLYSALPIRGDGSSVPRFLGSSVALAGTTTTATNTEEATDGEAEAPTGRGTETPRNRQREEPRNRGTEEPRNGQPEEPRNRGTEEPAQASAPPRQRATEPGVIGAVMVSQSTARILRAVWRVRLDLVEVFALSVLAAIVLSLMLAATIARPLIRLRDEADELLDHRGRLRRTFGGSRRRDEIGDLTRALERLTARLERHLVFVESFSADVSHEFKNPLASIRTASELLSQTDDPAQREQLANTVDKEVARLSRLLSGLREVSKVDAAVDTEAARAVDLRGALTELRATQSQLELALPSHAVAVTASEDRLMQAFRNVVDNAISFSPPDARVRVALAEHDGQAIVRVDDEGPGIPPEHLDRIFDRFFSFRPDGQRRDHDGLGLAITRAIVEAYGGTITASNRAPHGARIEIRLPVARS